MSGDAPLEFEPLPPSEEPAAAAAEPQPSSQVPWRGAPRVAKPRVPRPRGRVGTPVATSLVLHLVAFLLLILFLPIRSAPEETDDTVLTVNLRDWHWVGDDPEADGTGPRGPDPPAEPPKGPEVAPGFLEDDAVRGAVAGVGGSLAGSVYAGRLDGKEDAVASGGGDGGTEGAVHMALDWLARHQEKDGSWNARTYVRRCAEKGCEGACEEDWVVGSTALALLPFLGAGHSHRDGPWKDTVRAGLTWLHDRQLADGRFDDGLKRAYGDALATLAVCEAYGLTRNEGLGDMARRSVGFWVATQNAQGGWRYAVEDADADASVTGWVGMALASAKRAGIAVPDRTIARCRGLFAARTGADGVVGYTSTGIGSKSLLGVGYAVPVLLGAPPDDAALAATAACVERSPPVWPASVTGSGTFASDDPMHWYYGSLAAFQRGGTTWRIWNARLKPLLVGHQDRRRCSAGSWQPAGQTGVKAGRLVTTALCALSLEVYYRYPRAGAAR